MPKAKTSSTDKILCSCGCGDVVSRRTQTRHLQAHGPLMAVAGVVETRTYFHKRDADGSESPQPRKRQRVTSLVMEPAFPVTPAQQEPSPTNLLDNEPPTPLHTLTQPSPMDPTISKATHTALSAPWTGPTDFHYNDDEVFEDSNDVDYAGIELEPIIGIAEPDPSDLDDDEGELSGSETGGIPGVFDTNADLNTATYSEQTVILVD